MAVFRWRHFGGEIILWAVRWYCRYGISYRELEEMMGERGVCHRRDPRLRTTRPDFATVPFRGAFAEYKRGRQ